MPDKDPREPQAEAPATDVVPAKDLAPEVPPEGPTASGPAVIAGYLKTLPASPGVYRMLDAATAR